MTDTGHTAAYLAANLQALRRRSDYSQQQLAEAAGIPRSIPAG